MPSGLVARGYHAHLFAEKMPRLARRVDVLGSTMSTDREQLVADIAVNAMNLVNTEKEYCKFVKQYLDGDIGPAWHVICGRKFGAFVSAHDTESFCFRIDGFTFLVFRSISKHSILHR